MITFKSWWNGLRRFLAELIFKDKKLQSREIRNIIETWDALNKLAKEYNGNQFNIFTSKEINERINEFLGKKVYIQFRDKRYYGIPEPLMLLFNQLYSKVKPPYKSEISDCDDISMDYMWWWKQFAGMIPKARNMFAIGMISGSFEWIVGSHQVDIFVDHDGAVRLIEPQTPKVYDSGCNIVTLIYL